MNIQINWTCTLATIYVDALLAAFARYTCRSCHRSGRTVLNRPIQTGVCGWISRPSNHTFTSLKHTRATQLAIELNAWHSGRGTGWSLENILRRVHSCRPSDSYAFAFGTRCLTIAYRMCGPDRQVAAKRFRAEHPAPKQVAGGP